jgi:hypothetical protein
MKKILSVLIGLSFAGMAQAVDPNLNYVTPNGFQRGAEVSATFSGRRLADAEEILFYEPGVKVLSIDKKEDRSVVAKLKIAPDSELGEHRYRIRTKTGLSELRTFYVGPFKQIDELEKSTENNDIAKAEKIEPNITVAGKVNREDIDHYVFEAKKGEKLSVELEGIRLGRTSSSLFDAYVAFLDKDGKILKRSDDTHLLIQDPFLTMIAPYDGKYYVQVRETSMLGRGDVYRLHVGNFPRPHAVYPAGGRAGSSLDVEFIGDAGGNFSQSVLLPDEYDNRLVQSVFPVRRGVTAPSANPVRVSDFDNVLEKEPNDVWSTSTHNAEHETVPVAFNGLIEKLGDNDYFKFKAKKGQALLFNCYSRRIRSKLDTAIYLYDAKGKYLTGRTDSGGADANFTYTIKADGYYNVRIIDELGNFGPDSAYRIEVTEIKPGVSVYLPDTARYDTQTRKNIVVARGNRFAGLFYLRKENYRGDVQLGTENLPKGLKMVAGLWPSATTQWPVVFEAATNAPIGGVLGQITVASTNGSKTPVKGGIWQNYDLVRDGNRGTFYKTWSDKIAFVVADELPFKMSLEIPKTPIVRYGTKYIKVTVEKKKGWDEQILVRNLYKPSGIGASSYIRIPKGKTTGSYYFSANSRSALGKWKMAFIGEATVEGGRAWSSTELYDLDIGDYFVSGKIPLVTTIQGVDCKLVCQVTQKTAFDGKAKVTLGSLPSGCKAEPQYITKDSKEIVFDVKVSKTAKIGYDRNVYCDLFIEKNGETITQRFAYSGRLRIDPPKELVAQADTAKK